MKAKVITLNLDSLYRADEAERYRKFIQLHQLRTYHRDKILEEDDRKLPDYDRPLKRIEVVRKKFSFRKIINSLIP